MFTNNIKFFQKAALFHPHKPCLLTLKRHPDDSSPNQWDLPGGNVDFGELHLVALEREILEETGLSVIGLRVVDVVTKFDPKIQVYILFIGYQGRATSEAVQLSQEHIAYQWVSAADYVALDAPLTLRRMVEKLI